MARKKKVQKIATISAIEIFEMQKPRYNAYMCGHGAHGHKGYNRNKMKEQFRREEWQLTKVNSLPAASVEILWRHLTFLSKVILFNYPREKGKRC